MAKKKPRQSPAKPAGKPTGSFTATQGQYLAYLHRYRKLHRCSPSETEIAEFFRVSPPTVHQMIVKLEEKGLIMREPGVPRSVRVTVPRSAIPPLDGDEMDIADAVASAPQETARTSHIYTLEVFIIGGPISEKFLKRNPQISRTIEIRGDQTLEDLHHAIFKAFDRFDEHMYEFQFGKGPNDPKGKRYVLPHARDIREPNVAGSVAETTIDALGLKVDQPFGYWFDFGDDWWHQIDVVRIDEKASKIKYPRVTKRVGKSPPQYMDEDE